MSALSAPETNTLLHALEHSNPHEELIDTMTRAETFLANRNGEPVLHGSPAFNTYTQACALLARSPLSPLAESPISDIPDQTCKVGHLLIKLVNESITRDATTSGYGFTVRERRSGLGTCASAEAHFTHALGFNAVQHLVVSNRQRPNELYTHDGKAIFFKKGYEVPTAISFQPIAINGVEFMPGTLFQIVNPKDASDGTPLNKGGTLLQRPISDIGSIAPLRLSTFSITPKEAGLDFDPIAHLRGKVALDNLLQHIPQMHE